MELDVIELELKKRWAYPYQWGRKQNDKWDQYTSFIYRINTFEDLLVKISKFSDDLKNYALNRWYNFWSAKAVEYIFSLNSNVIPNKNQYDKLVDFTINNIPFDHKTSIYPQAFNYPFEYAYQHKKDLIQWLYINQSQQGRKHLKNRLFVIVYDTKLGEHWKMKAEIFLIKKQIEDYLENFNTNNLIELNFDGQFAKSDIIWIIK